MERSTGLERLKADLCMSVAGTVFGVLAPSEPACHAGGRLWLATGACVENVYDSKMVQVNILTS